MASWNVMENSVIKEAGTEVARFIGYSSLKSEQEQIISGILSKRDVFGILPIGFGKSLCHASLPNNI